MTTGEAIFSKWVALKYAINFFDMIQYSTNILPLSAIVILILVKIEKNVYKFS